MMMLSAVRGEATWDWRRTGDDRLNSRPSEAIREMSHKTRYDRNRNVSTFAGVYMNVAWEG